MKYAEGKADELKQKFWKAMADSPYVFLELDGRPETAVVMTAQLDKDANSSIWFFSHRNSEFTKLGGATVNFASKGHDMFARFDGTLTEETSRERFEQFWNNFVEAWYDGGKDDRDIFFMRMDLGNAEIWGSELGVLNTAKMALGMYVEPKAEEQHVKSTPL